MTTVLVGYGRMPTDPPGGDAWVEVWANYAHDVSPLEVVQLGWRKSPAEMAEAYSTWLNSRPDLADAMLCIAGGNFRALRSVVAETYNAEKERTDGQA